MSPGSLPELFWICLLTNMYRISYEKYFSKKIANRKTNLDFCVYEVKRIEKIMKNLLKQTEAVLNQELFRQQKINQLLAKACFRDDVFNRAIFSNCTKKQKIEIVQTILRRILKKQGLIVVSVRYQKDLKELGAHSAVMDIVAIDGDGQKYNLEFQMSPPLSFARLETYSSFMIKASLRSGQEYSELKHTWVIFITNQRYWTDTKEKIFDSDPVVLYEICKVIDNQHGRRIRSTHSHLYVVDAL